MQTVSTHHQNLTKQSSREALYIVTMDTDMDSSLRDRLVRTRISNTIEREGQMVSSSFNIRENRRSVEWLLKQSLNAFKLIQNRFNFVSTCFSTVERGEQTVSASGAVQHNRDFKQIATAISNTTFVDAEARGEYVTVVCQF